MLGYGKYRYTLLVTVSAAALSLTVEHGPLAADLVAPTARDHWWASLEGQYLFFDGDDAKYDEGVGFSGDSFKLKPGDGWGIAGEVGFRPGDGPWSFVGRIRYGVGSKDNSDSNFRTSFGGIFFSSSAKADHREDHLIADLEIGRDVGLGALGDRSNLRLFAGVRFAHFKANGSESGSGYDRAGYQTSQFALDFRIRREFDGIGPRVGFAATMPLSDQLALDLGAAGALLYGKQKFDASGGYRRGIYSSPENEKRSQMAWIPNLEGSAALSWLVSDDAKFSFGYRVDSYFDVYDDGDVFSGRDEGDRIIHGPFVKLTFGGGG